MDAKQVDFSYGDFLTAVRVMSKGGKNRAIGVGQVFQGGGFLFLEGSGIKIPKDLEGRCFGTTPAGFGNVLLPVMAAASGFDQKKIIKKIMKPAVRTPTLFPDHGPRRRSHFRGCRIRKHPPQGRDAESE